MFPLPPSPLILQNEIKSLKTLIEKYDVEAQTREVQGQKRWEEGEAERKKLYYDLLLNERKLTQRLRRRHLLNLAVQKLNRGDEGLADQDKERLLRWRDRIRHADDIAAHSVSERNIQEAVLSCTNETDRIYLSNIFQFVFGREPRLQEEEEGI